MAHLGNTVVNGALRVLGQTTEDALQVTSINGVTVGNSPKFTDQSVTASGNHYAPATVSGQDKTASASGATAAWSIDVVKGVTLNTDGKGHVTGISVTSGKIPGNPNTDVKVTQTADDSTDSDSYEVLFSGSANNTTATEGAKKSSRLKINPKYGRVITRGPLIVEADNAVGSYDEGIRINRGKAGYATLHIGGADGSTTGTGASQWWIGCNPASYARKLFIAQNGNTSSATYFGSDADSTVSPYLNLGTSGSIASGNTRAVTGGAVYSFVTGGSARDNTKIPTSDRKKYLISVNRESSMTSSSTGNWVSMCNYGQTGNPTCPDTSHWYHIINLNPWTDSTTNWITQLAISTQDTKNGVWWRCNDTGGTDISNSRWNHLFSDGDEYIFPDNVRFNENYGIVTKYKGTNGWNTQCYSKKGYRAHFQLTFTCDSGALMVGVSTNPSSSVGYENLNYAWYIEGNNYASIYESGTKVGDKVCSATDNAQFVIEYDGTLMKYYSNGVLYRQVTVVYSNSRTYYMNSSIYTTGSHFNNLSFKSIHWNRLLSADNLFIVDNANTIWNGDCNSFNHSGFFWGRSNVPTASDGNAAPDNTALVINHQFNNSWIDQIAMDSYNHGKLFTRCKSNGTWTQWYRCIDSNDIGTARIQRTVSGGSYLIIKMKYGDDYLNTGMFTFKVSLYDNYVMRIYQISGYCYGGNHWYQPRAKKLAQSGNNGSNELLYDNVYFRYDSSHNLYVYIYQGSYAGALISDVCNGYNRIADLSKIFELSYGSLDGTTTQTSEYCLGTGNFDTIDASSYLSVTLSPSTAGTRTLDYNGSVKMLSIWGTTWTGTSGGARQVMTITNDRLKPTRNIEIFGHDDNGQVVFGYITNTGLICIANRNAVPVYITATYI